MITRLRFKNWRSLRDVTIDDLTPITVFIGANSSGKTNILDALYFLRDAVGRSLLEAWNQRLPPADYRTLGSTDILELEFSFRVENNQRGLTYKYSENSPNYGTNFYEQLIDNTGTILLESDPKEIKAKNNAGELTSVKRSGNLGLSAFGRLSTYPEIQETFQFITQRWQMLDENFMPPMSGDSRSSYDPLVINRCADNLPTMLQFMQENHKDFYPQLQEDLAWLLGHVERLEVTQLNYLLKTQIFEKMRSDRQSPTVSAGTARIMAMLTAYYALDMRSPEMPGLIVIEEPDTALNPGLLERFVEQLRTYTEREGYPRQFILTTHNPTFLNYFKPEEVRVVERDEQGYTTVKRIPDHVSEIWLDKFGLGEVWTTRSFGGVPE